MIFIIQTNDEVSGLDITNLLNFAHIEHAILSKQNDEAAERKPLDASLPAKRKKKTMSNQRKWKCCSCDGISAEADLLEATNPFDETMKITGCPICKDVTGFTEICDEPGCVRDASCSFPTPEGYRRTCGYHMRVSKKDATPTKQS